MKQRKLFTYLHTIFSYEINYKCGRERLMEQSCRQDKILTGEGGREFGIYLLGTQQNSYFISHLLGG